MNRRARGVALALGMTVIAAPLLPVEAAPTTKLVSRTSDGPKADDDSLEPAISADGRFVAFRSRADNLPGGDGTTSQVYLRDLRTNTTRLVSRISGGPAADGGNSFDPSISADGRFVAFSSRAANLPAGDGLTFHVYLYSRISNALKLVSRIPGGPAADDDSEVPSISADGRFVAFNSQADNLPGGDGNTEHIYLYDRTTNTIRLVSRIPGGPAADGHSFEPSVSDDGRFVAFQSEAANLPAGDGATERVYLYDRIANTLRLVSRIPGGSAADGKSFSPSVSDDGRFVAFHSEAANLPGGDGTTSQVYLYNRIANTLRLVSRTSDGPKADGVSIDASISADGRSVAFRSRAANLPGGDGMTFLIYIHDRQTQNTRLVSRVSGGPAADGNNDDPSISADGRFVAFFSQADNLPGGDGTTRHTYRRGPL